MEMPSYDKYVYEKDNQDLSQIPGTFGYPVIGHTFDFLKDPLALMLSEHEKYGPIFRQSFAFQRMVAYARARYA